MNAAPVATGSGRGLLDLLFPVYIILMVLLNPLAFGHQVANGIFAVLFMLFSLEVLMGRIEVRVSRLLVLFALTIVGHLLPILVGEAIYLDLAVQGVIQPTLLLALLLLFDSYIQDQHKLRTALLCATIGYVGIYAWGHLYLQRDLAGRAIALFENPNAAGIWSVYAFCCVRILWRMGSLKDTVVGPLQRLWLIVVASASLHLIFASQSRKSLLVVLVILAWDTVQFVRRSRYKIPVLGFLATVLFALSTAAFLLPEAPILNRLTGAWRTLTDPTVTSREQDTGLIMRQEFYRVGLEIIRENPVMGQGVGAFRALSSQYSNRIAQDRVTHSTFLDMYIEGGLLAFAAYVALWGTLAWALWKRRRESDTYVLLLLIVLLIGGLELGSWRYMDKLKYMMLIGIQFAVRQGLFSQQPGEQEAVADRPALSLPRLGGISREPV